MASIDNALTTLARVKSYLELTGSSKDVLLTMLTLAASKFVEDYCMRKFKRQTFTQELYDGKDTKRLYLKNRPIVTGTTVTLQYRTNATNDDDWQTIETTAYFINYKAGYLEFQRGYVDAFLGLQTRFIEGTQNYRVTYTSGFYLPSNSLYQDGTDDDLDLPYELELAVLDMVSLMFNTRRSGGIKSETVGEISIDYAKDVEQNPHIKIALDRHKRAAYG